MATALTIAGSDSGGGAGIQADLKAFSARGVYGTSVITALTAQNTCAVTAVEITPVAMIRAQIAAVFDDIAVDAVKIGMLGTPEVIATVAEGLTGFKGPVVLDPVMVAKSGDALLAAEAEEALAEQLLPRATVLTPNLPEAARLLKREESDDPAAMLDAGQALRAMGPAAVLMKGGHGRGETCVDLLIDGSTAPLRLEAPRIPTRNTHGTGCTLSASIAAELAKGADLRAAVTAAHGYLQGAIAKADSLGIGQGHGPVHHFHEFWS
ncbi:MAG: bifunctional hydroxymethylpyrimidine kinase/phosphomethylpyrimidine kinase [Pseudomonadota bacterium]